MTPRLKLLPGRGAVHTCAQRREAVRPDLVAEVAHALLRCPLEDLEQVHRQVVQGRRP